MRSGIRRVIGRLAASGLTRLAIHAGMATAARTAAIPPPAAQTRPDSSITIRVKNAW